MPVAEGLPGARPDTAPPSIGRPSGREILASLALAALGFVVMAGTLHAAIRDPLHLHADVRSEKLVMLQQWHGKIFSAAFGTSHVHNGFDPRVFDRTLAGSPAASHTANLAIEGGSQTEQLVMASQFVKQLEPPTQAGGAPEPCMVILELGAGTNFTNDHLVHPRAINIYDRHTASLAADFVRPDMGATQRVGRIGYALAAMGLHYANVGMLSNEIFAPPLNQDILTNQTIEDRRGELVEHETPLKIQEMTDLMARTGDHPALVPGEVLPGHTVLVQRLAALNAAPHLSFVYVVMPAVMDLATMHDYPDHLSVRLPEGAVDVPIINLARPDRFPELYHPPLWFDAAHLDDEGAQLASRLLAEQLKRWYAAHGGPVPCG